MRAPSAARAVPVPLDGDLVASDDAAPEVLRQQVKTREAAGLPTFARQYDAGDGVEQEGNDVGRYVKIALGTSRHRPGQFGRAIVEIPSCGRYAGKIEQLLLPIRRQH